MIDLNEDGPADDWLDMLEAAEANAETEFEITFCESLRNKFETFGSRSRLSAAQLHKLKCIAAAGGFWERSA